MESHPTLPRRKSLEGVKNLFRFVLTGGPCGGKTTAIVQIADRLRSLGYQVYVVPEVATIMHTSGLVYPAQGTEEDKVAYEISRLKTQMALEDYYSACHFFKPTVVLCDRGTMDSMAYVTEEQWSVILSTNNWTPVSLRDSRYDGIVHLTTAALGAVSFYTKENNQARRETAQEAISLDEKTRDCWLGHNSFKIIENAMEFSTKMKKASEFIFDKLGLVAPSNARRKFNVKTKEMEPFPVKFQDCHLISTFLSSTDPDVDYVVRKRGQDGQFFYSYSKRTKQHTNSAPLSPMSPNPAARLETTTFLTTLASPTTPASPMTPASPSENHSSSTKSTAHSGNSGNELKVPTSSSSEEKLQVIVEQRHISAQTYLSLLHQKDPKKKPVERFRRCFIWQNRYFELDYLPTKNSPALLIVEASKDDKIDMPPFVEVVKEISSDNVLGSLADGSEI